MVEHSPNNEDTQLLTFHPPLIVSSNQDLDNSQPANNGNPTLGTPNLVRQVELIFIQKNLSIVIKRVEQAMAMIISTPPEVKEFIVPKYYIRQV